MLKVLVFNPFSLENGRGGEISSMELAAGLNKYYNIVLVDSNILFGEKILTREAIKNKTKEIQKIERINFATLNIFNKIFNFPYPWEILKLYRMIKKSDIIYASISFFKIDLLFIFFSLLHPRAKFIIGYRKPLHSEKILSLYNIKYRLSILFFSLFKNRFYHHTISYHAKKYLENFYDPNKVIYIIHGIELDNYINKEIKMKNSETLKFIYVGALEDPHKGFNVLLNAINLLLEENQDLKIFFEFCGVGPLKSKLKNLQEKFPQFITYHGYVSNDKLSEIYNQNDVFLFTSRDEPFGRVLIEALASNLIIICTVTIGSLEILKKRSFAFFIQDLNPKAIKEKIHELYNSWTNNLQKFRQLQKSAKKHALQHHSFSIELKGFKDLIDKISSDLI